MLIRWVTIPDHPGVVLLQNPRVKGPHAPRISPRTFCLVVLVVRRFAGSPPAGRGAQAPQNVSVTFNGETDALDPLAVGQWHILTANCACKVARCAQNVYFYVRTRQPITPYTDVHWMWLLIDADSNPATGWQGYDFILNRRVEGDAATWLEQNTGGWNWKAKAKVSYRAQGHDFHAAIPRSTLGLPENTSRLSIQFKWADNQQTPGDIMDFYLSGDVAPEGRFVYRYTAP